MGLLSRLTLAKRLLLGFGAMLGLLVAMAALSLIRMNDLSGALEQITVRNAARSQAVDALARGVGGYVQALGDLTSSSLTEGQAVIVRLDKILADYDAAMLAIPKLLPESGPARAHLGSIVEKAELARALIAIGIKNAEGRGEAARAFHTRNEYTKDPAAWSARQQAWAQAIADLNTWTNEADAALAARTNASASSARLMLVGGGLGALLIGGILAVLIIRDTVGAIDSAVQATRRMAGHDLSQPISTARRDEIGVLLGALEEMRLNLNELAGGVRRTCDDITTASSEIAQGSMELSTRTASTATTLQQTVSTIAQLTESVNQTTESARSANAMSDEASQIADRNGRVVSEAVSTMEEISVASRRIADIIAIIDGIAFQTNILALNAAVEAARAGEQGRGFAVVATEVRALAGRSAGAAQEIKALIEDSLSKVETGAAQVGRAGTTTTEIVGSVQRVSSMIDAITHEADQQRSDIGLANQSIGHLDNDVQQNAALAEESAAAAATLRQLAEQLGDLVGKFELSEAAAA